MLTQEQVLSAIKAGKKSETLDGRDYARLCDFFPESDWEALGFTRKDGVDSQPPVAWSDENIRKQLASDVAFGFEKALNKRGISASFMYAVVQMWMWVFEDDLQHHSDYAQYGLPLFKAVAIKYGLPNPIGDKCGDEPEFESD